MMRGCQQIYRGACTIVGGIIRGPSRGLGLADLVAESSHLLLSRAPSLSQAKLEVCIPLDIPRYKNSLVTEASGPERSTAIKMEDLRTSVSGYQRLCSLAGVGAGTQIF